MNGLADARRQAEDRIHKKCLQANDYRGCMTSHGASPPMTEYERESLAEQRRLREQQAMRERHRLERQMLESEIRMKGLDLLEEQQRRRSMERTGQLGVELLQLMKQNPSNY